MRRALQTISIKKRLLALSFILLGLGGLIVLFSGTNVSATGRVFHVSPTACLDSGPGTEAEPFCWLQQAINAAAEDDTIYVHEGTYSYHSADCDGDSKCWSMVWYPTETNYLIKSAAIVNKPGVIISVPAGETVIFDLNNQLEVGVWIAAPGVTVSNLHIANQHPSGSDSMRLGAIVVGECVEWPTGMVVGCPISQPFVPGGIVIEGVDIDIPYCDAISGISDEHGIFAYGSLIDNLVIRNNIISGKFQFAIFFQQGLGAYGAGSPSSGASIYGNTIIGTKQTSCATMRQVGILIEQLGNNDDTGILARTHPKNLLSKITTQPS